MENSKPCKHTWERFLKEKVRLRTQDKSEISNLHDNIMGNLIKIKTFQRDNKSFLEG